MSQTTASPEDDALLAAFEQNEFDIAGLAEFCVESRCMDRCLRQIHQIIRQHREPRGREKRLLAQILAAMIFVARNDYAAEGHQEYWPFLFARVRRTMSADPAGFWDETAEGPVYQGLLGRWFLAALKAFGYSIPDEGQRYVGPIVFHAGIPCASLPRVLSVIASACDEFGPQAISLPADVRSALVSNQSLHRNAERLLASNLQGAEQLWACLARVVLAWNILGDCSDELQQLPLALDPEEVRAALPSESQLPRGPRAALPHLRYDRDTGEIRLTFPGDASTHWKVTRGKSPIELSWVRTHLGASAEFLAPLPQEICVAPTNPDAAIGRTFAPQPSHWPGYWFHAHNGNLEDGRTIDASGLPSGRWYVVFDGTPTSFSEGLLGQVQLKWSWFQGYEHWTAWEVEVPARTTSRTCLEWRVGDNCFSVPLARRPGPRVEFVDQPVARASTPDGNQLDVFASIPRVVLKRESPVALHLLRETGDSVPVIERIELMPEAPSRVPLTQAGVYQLRESRGVGRTVLRFAIVPGLRIEGPTLDRHRRLACVMIDADPNAGGIDWDEGADVSRHGHAWVTKASTVEPFLQTRWRWNSEDVPVLTLRWPLEALRWRVTRGGEQYAAWTREPIVISPQAVAQHDAQLEIQLPVGSELAVNGEVYSGRLQHGPSGNTIVLSLLAFGESVELEHEGLRYAAVLQSERPLLESLQGTAASESVTVRWRASEDSSAMVMVAWDPCDVLSSPTTFPLSQTDLASGESHRAYSELPGTHWTAISLARSGGGFFQRVLHLAAHRARGIAPVSLLLDRSTGTLTSYDEAGAGWIGLLHHLTLMRLYRRDGWDRDLDRWIAELGPSTELDLETAISLVRDLQQLLNDQATADRDRCWAEPVLRAVLRLLRRCVGQNPARSLRHEDVGDRLSVLLRLGVPVGQMLPFGWIAKCEALPHSAPYPLQYVCDLWLLGTGRKYLETQLSATGASVPEDFDAMQTIAASRVLRFHQENGMPALSAFLPLAGRTATTATNDRGHRHAFALPAVAKSFESAGDLCEVLGLEDKAIDCQATCDDQFFDQRQGETASRVRRGPKAGNVSRLMAGYSLYWSADEERWAIEILHCSPPTCCYGGPLLVDPIRPADLAKCTLRDVLNRWSHEERPASGFEAAFGFLDSHRDALVSDAVSGPLHAELFKPAEIETRALFGASIRLETKPGLSPLAAIAWQLAWIERVAAWQGAGRILRDNTENVAAQHQFLGALAGAMRAWPNLMRRTIALAELVYWTLYRGGLGTAARFRCQHTEAQLPRENATAQERSAEVTVRPSPRKDRVDNISGIIVGYNIGLGNILLHHRNSPSLDATVSDYVEHEDRARHWLASFRWNTLRGEDRDRLQQFLSQLRKREHKERATLADVMCGLRVTCDLERKPTWRAIKIDIHFAAPGIRLPKHRRWPQNRN